MTGEQKTSDSQSHAELGERLRIARETLGLTQSDTATALGVPRSSVVAMEAGQRKVTGLELRRLARLYRRSVDWLLGSVESQPDVEGAALFRAAAQLTDNDKLQVLRFAEFLAAQPSAGGEDRAPGRRPRPPQQP